MSIRRGPLKPSFINTYSMKFDGVDDKIELGTQSLGLTGAISVSAWVKIPTTNTGGGGTNIQVVACEDVTSTGRNWSMYWRGGGQDYFSFAVWHTDGSFTGINSTGIVPNDGEWHHLLGTYDGTTSVNGLKLFVDGNVFQTTAVSSGVRSVTGVEPTIGSLSRGLNWFFEGNIDEVSIFNTDQSANVSTIYNSRIPNNLTDLSPLHWYRMGEDASFNGTNWTLVDQGSGGNNATSTNMDLIDRVEDTP